MIISAPLPSQMVKQRPTVAFVLLSYRTDEPAGIERAVAGLAAGLRADGRQSLIITAAPGPDSDPAVVRLRRLPVTFPSTDSRLRDSIETNHAALVQELTDILDQHQVDLVVYVDALWGLGRIAADIPRDGVLAVHVIGHDQDLAPALTAASTVIAPSVSLLSEATRKGYDTTRWQVVPNPLLVDPDLVPRPDPLAREALRRNGPIRIAARLGTEKGVSDLLAAPRPGARPVELALAKASFETVAGAQDVLLARWTAIASAAGITVRPPMAWAEMPEWLAGAALTIVPSRRETFGNVAAESLSAGTPVVAYSTGNLPDLVGRGGALAPTDADAAELWSVAARLLDDPIRYAATCGAAYYRSRDFRPTTVAEAFLKAVW